MRWLLCLILLVPSIASAQKRVNMEQLYVTALAAGVTAAIRSPNVVSDIGGYTDEHWTKDKWEHGGISFALAYGAIDAGIKPYKAVVYTCVAGAAFEWAQRFNGERESGHGFASSKDMQWNCAGAVIAIPVHWAIHRYRQKD